MLSASGNLFKGHEEVLYLQPLIPPKRFDIFPPTTGGCTEGLGVLCFFLKQQHGESIGPKTCLVVVVVIPRGAVSNPVWSTVVCCTVGW